jgi:hypothetical protein
MAGRIGVGRCVKPALIAPALGLAFGVLMALPLAFAVQLSKTALESINAPALWLARSWTYDFGLPPRGEIAWVVVPMAAIVLQWTVLGLLIGLCFCFRSRRTRPVSLDDNQARMSDKNV